jgi:clan AA aspartic protease
MAAIRGSFADSAPVVSVIVSTGPASVPITAVVDTGFDGFAAVPVALVESLGLRPGAIANVEYADGSIGTVALASAQNVLGHETREGLVHVQPTSGEALIGIDLLRSFRKIFVLSVAAGAVLLVDEASEIENV